MFNLMTFLIIDFILSYYSKNKKLLKRKMEKGQLLIIVSVSQTRFTNIRPNKSFLNKSFRS